MQQKQFIESKIEEFNKIAERFPSDSERDLETYDMLLDLFSTALKEIVQEHFKYIMVEKLSRKDWDMECDPDSYFFIGIHQHEGNNHCLDQITSRHNKYLS